MLHKIWEGWKAFGQLIGNLLARIVLTIFYFTVFVPFGVGTGLFSDQLGIKTTPNKFWQIRGNSTDTLEAARRQS
jgi:hypothetical protein